jgi:hypothetical protein
MDQLAAAEPTALRCTRHPAVETLLRCGRCETPICPRCVVQTPVGARCPDCARVRRPPTYDLTGHYLWQALGLAALLIAAGGFAFGILAGFAGRSIFFGAILYALAGIAIAELLSASANRKRGPRLQVLAAVTTVLVTQWPLLAALAVAHRLVVNPLALVLSLVAAAIAWARLR